MTRPLALTENQARTLIRAARKERALIEVKIGDAVVTVFPDDNRDENRKVDTSSNPDAPTNLDNWKRARNEGKAYGRS